MAWGNILSQVGTFTGGPLIGAGVSFLGNLLDSNDQKKKAKKAENEYYAALAQQKQLAELTAHLTCLHEDTILLRLLRQVRQRARRSGSRIPEDP